MSGVVNLYLGVVTDLPKGMPIGSSIKEDAGLVGYFFKLQGYISLQQQLDAERTGKKPITLKAPLILGRLIWTAPPSVAQENTPFWLLATIGSVGVVLVIGWVLLAARRSRRPSLPAIVPGPSLDPEEPSVDNWLDQAQSGRLALEPVPETTARYDGAALEGGFGGRLAGNIFSENSESKNGHRSDNGHGGMDPEIRDQGSPDGG